MLFDYTGIIIPLGALVNAKGRAKCPLPFKKGGAQRKRA